MNFREERNCKMTSIQDTLQSQNGPLRWDRNHYCAKHQSEFLFMPPTFTASQCPVCGSERLHAQFAAEMQKQCTGGERLRKYHTLAKQSIIQDKTIIEASFENFIVQTEEEHCNKMQAIEAAERFAKGEAFNLWIQSPQTG